MTWCPRILRGFRRGEQILENLLSYFAGLDLGFAPMNNNGLLENLARFKTGRSKRISSYNRLGGNSDKIYIAPGETVDIAHIKGAGFIKHIWMTLSHKDPMHLRNMLIRMYWDGAKKPSVQSTLGEFFGQGWGERYPYVALPVTVSPANALNTYFPMPFRIIMSITKSGIPSMTTSAIFTQNGVGRITCRRRTVKTNGRSSGLSPRT
jgi:hypothetical protein